MKIVNIHEAKTHFSKLVDAVINGSEILITIAGKPVAKLGPISAKPQRKFGALEGKIKISKDFDAALSDEIFTEFKS